MRICILIDAWEPIWGGGQVHVAEICRRLIRIHNIQIDIYTRALVYKKKKYVRSEVNTNGNLRLFRIGPATDFFNLWGRTSWLLTVFIAVIKHHRQEKYALIHAHAYTASLPGKILSLVLGIPVVFTVHGANTLDIDKLPQALIERFLLTWIRYDAEISVSQRFLKYPNRNPRLVVIPNGVDISSFAKISVRRSKNLFIFLWVGRFDWVKGVDILIRAFSEVHAQYPETSLILVGDGQEEQRLILLASAIGIKQNIRFTGRKSGKALIKLYKKANVFVLPSRAEGAPLTLLEAMAAKLPIIATHVGDNAYLVKNGVSGYLVSPEDVDDLVEKMKKMIKSRDLTMMGRKGFQLVRFLTWEKTAEKTAAVYKKLLEVS